MNVASPVAPVVTFSPGAAIPGPVSVNSHPASLPAGSVTLMTLALACAVFVNVQLKILSASAG